MGIKERLERRRTGFFFALKKQCHLHWQIAVNGFVGTACFDKGHELPLVIGCSATGQDLATIANVLDCRLKWIVVPEIEWINRLHIIMAVEQHMCRISSGTVMMGNNHRVPRRVAHTGIKANGFQVFDQPFGGLPAVGLVSRVSRDRLDPQKIKEVIDALIEIGVEIIEDFIE